MKGIFLAVYIMGAVLVVLFIVLIGGVIWKSTHKVAAVPAGPPARVSLGLPAGTAIQSMQIDGDRLAVNTGAEIVIVDLRRNVVVSRVAVSQP